ncbi:Cobyric acid synthase [Desulfamplus magnetovallimortis]|uniref:Cobyric acid synthase n=1 Tax=Desulfamplus magnetovallimortis TaxID=1246637 RepID=A0A1W1HCT6_9BACT|nr:cobyric acid synthase [Desulfamplus magnetovallimortis]SLM30253.1 Cobyric acid synthase [Desulfamplus magnetovallimortis]
MRKFKPIAVFGTGSDVGKSIVGAAICKSLADRGVAVAPFKAQNMSNNSGITPEGLEMGRAQIVQAEAAGVVPHVDMNPVLLKPTGEKGSQVVLNGVAVENSTAMEYHSKKEFYFNEACRAFDRLRDRYEMIVMEGAGSCAEVNLMPSDIVNFRMADYAGADVILVADIHRGGVFGQLVGTLECLPDRYRDMIKGFIINRFRGDIKLFREGVEWIEKRTGKKVMGVLPWYHHFRIDAEDSVELEVLSSVSSLEKNKPAIAVIKLKHISNFTDFHALADTPGLQVIFLEKPVELDRFKAVIIPGSKNTRSDLQWLKQTGWDQKIKSFAASGGHILGICGGYQILGKHVDDPNGLEGNPGITDGLDLLPVNTILKAPKITTLSTFIWYDFTRDFLDIGEGYEIHMGHTTRFAGSPMFKVHSRNSMVCHDEDGTVSREKNICGTYMHGLFDVPVIKNRWLEQAGIDMEQHLYDNRASSYEPDGIARKKRDYQLLKEHFESHVELDIVFPALSRQL